MYYRNRGSARIMLAGGGLLSLLIVVVIISYMGGESAQQAGKTKQHAEKQVKQIQKDIDEYNRKISAMAEGSFDVILEDVGPHEEDVIKAVRSLRQIGLKEARDIVRSEDGIVLTGITKAEAQNAKRQLEQAGATVKIDKRRD